MSSSVGNGTNGVALPSWFLWTVSVVGVIGLPWVIWTTGAIFSIQYTRDIVMSNTARITDVDTALRNHDAQLQVIAATRFTSADGRTLVLGVESKIDRLGEKIEQLQRDFDRRFGVKVGEAPP